MCHKNTKIVIVTSRKDTLVAILFTSVFGEDPGLFYSTSVNQLLNIHLHFEESLFTRLVKCTWTRK